MIELTLTIVNQFHKGERYNYKHQGLPLHDCLSILLEPTSILQLILLYYVVIAGRFVFAGTNGWGWPNFIPRGTLKSKSGGYLVGSNCIVKADISIIGLSSETSADKA
jgi:hypothetical protein